MMTWLLVVEYSLFAREFDPADVGLISFQYKRGQFLVAARTPGVRVPIFTVRQAAHVLGNRLEPLSGITMARVIFASHTVGAAVLPLMLFHQIQLMVCAALAQRWGRRAETLSSLASADAFSRSSRHGGRTKIG